MQTIKEIRQATATENRKFNLMPDTKLETWEQLNSRLESIKAQLEKLCDKPYSHNIRAMELLDSKIRKLDTRKAKIQLRLSQLKRSILIGM